MALNATHVTKFLKRLKSLIFPAPPPVIPTEFGPVTESARHQAALNMKADPEIRRRVEAVLVTQLGPVKGLEESRRRYPEAYADEKEN